VVDLNRLSTGYQSINFITPRIGLTPGGLAPSDGLRTDSEENLQRRQNMTENLFKTKYGEDSKEGVGLRAGKFLASAGVDMVDMVAGSLVPGVDRGDVWSQLSDQGLSGLANFAERNRSGVELTSGLVAAVATGAVAEMAILPMLATRLAASSALTSSRIYQAGNKYFQGAKALAADSAMSAAVAGEAATVLGTTGGRALLQARIAEGVGKAAFSEAAIVAVTHSNQEMWSEDASTNLAMMALGLGIGGALGGLGARFEMRQLANSESVVGRRIAASDPYGYTSLRVFQPDQSAQAALGKNAEFKESATVTSLMLSARQQVPENLPASRKALLEQESKQVEQQAYEALQKITVKGVEGVNGSNFSLVGPRNRLEAEHIKTALHKDPTLLMQVDSLGTGHFGRNLEARDRYIAGLRESQETADWRLARKLESQEPLGLVNGSWMPATDQLKKLADYRPDEVKIVKIGKTPGTYEFKMDLGKGKVVKIDDNAGIMAQGRKFEDLDIVSQMQVYEGLNHMTRQMLRRGHEFVLPENATWLQLDFAQNYKKAGGTVNLEKQSKYKTLEDAEIGSFRLKAQALVNKGKDGNLDFYGRASLNLPLPNSLERIHDGTSINLLELLKGAAKNENMTAAEAREIRTKLLQAADLRTGIKGKEADITGDMFNFNRNKSGEWQPILTGFASYERVSPERLGTREALLVATAENKIYRAERLAEGIHSNELVTNLMRTPEFAESQKLVGLAKDQITGAGGALDQGLGTMVTKQMRYRDSAPMLAATKVREAIDRSIDEYTNRLIVNGFQGTQNALAGVPNRGSKAMVDSFFSFNSGWDLERAAVVNADGTFNFALSNTPKNAQRLGRAVNEDDLLMNPRTGRPITVDQTGMDFISRFQRVAQTLLKDTNAIRASRGMEPIAPKAWYNPPPSTRGKIIGFTLDANGKTVPGGAIVAKTQEEFNALRAAKLKELDEAGEGHRFFSQSEIEATADLWDHAEMGWVDPGFLGSPGRSQTGALFGDSMNPRAMEDAMEWVAERVRTNANGAVRSIYDQQIAVARARSAADDAVSGSQRRNIWDEWEATILGKPLVSVKAGEGTRAVQAVERVAQSLINTGWPLVNAIGGTQVAQWTSDLASRLGVKRLKNFKTFDELASQLGPHSPYASASEFLAANTRAAIPPEVGEIASSINRFSASVLLRWFEFPNAAMNLIGVITNMPSIIRSPSTPLLGSIVGAEGKKIGVVDSYRILAGGFADMLSGSKHADWDVMVKNGDTTQSIAELNKQLSLIESKSTFWKVMGGDKTVQVQQRIPRSGKEAREQLTHKGVDGLISLATDTTESMSRSWSHFIGLRLADANGIVGTEARHAFAREVANQAIANYNPLNKPELFQTSIGSMFGLFASYMQQYNQRLFRWMETGDYLSAGRQLAMQSALFGTTSVPGYNVLESLFTGMGSHPDATITDAIYAKYGPKVGSIIAHGGIQELPRLFGLDMSVALYTRGDANFRAPTIDPTRLMAGLNIVSGIAEGMWAVAQKAVNPNEEFSARYIGEVMARQMPNRAMKGTLQALLTDGMEIDASGQVVTRTKDWLETGARILGLRSGRQQGEVEAYYANTTQRRRQAARMEVLREETRMALRSGGKVDYPAIFQKYVEKGGAPSHFKTWIQDQIATVQDTRGMRQFVESLGSDKSQMEAWRYEMRQ
jgi:hypothetical protein